MSEKEMSAKESEQPQLAENNNENEEKPTQETGGSNVEQKTGKEFDYLDRNEFTSEIYKIEIKNLGYFGIGDLKKLLKNTLSLDITKIKSPAGKEYAFVCFRSQADQQRALETLNGYKWKGKILKALAANASADPLQKRRREADSGDSPKRKRTAAEATCPLSTLSYDQQLAYKTTQTSALLKKYMQELCRLNRSAKQHLNNFLFQGVLPSPLVNGYRNKNEFTVGKNDLGEIVVGFRLGSYSDGSVEVADVQQLAHLPPQAKWAAKSFQQLVRQSKFLPFNPEGNTGHYRQLMVRTSSTTKEIMLVAGIYSTNLSRVEIMELQCEIKRFYEQPEQMGTYKCTSLYYQEVKHREAGQMVDPLKHLSGTTHITDNIMGLQYRISPLAFFQVNTAGADVLYHEAMELVDPTEDTVVLDICCGTGTIALSFARRCKRVLGVEIVPDAIKDAEFNAEMNNIKNCKFFAGNADDYIKTMVQEAMYSHTSDKAIDLVAVVDPPRAGLHNRSIIAIRSASEITRLVYLACDPQSAMRNFIDLSRPESKQYRGEPFYPITAVAVDMFPHTKHTELVILFERESKTKPTEAVVEDKTVDTEIECVEDVPSTITETTTATTSPTATTSSATTSPTATTSSATTSPTATTSSATTTTPTSTP